MKTSIFKVTAAVALIVLVACATSGYNAASQSYDADSSLYKAAGANIESKRLTGHVSTAQWNQFVNDTAAERVADAQVYADLVAWKNSGQKPTNYDLHARLLADEQAKVKALSDEVSK